MVAAGSLQRNDRAALAATADQAEKDRQFQRNSSGFARSH
jgi:hypothetical protein